jgi:hypothetical protein
MSTGVLKTCGELEQIYTKKIVRQVGYLQELNRVSRSTKHKIIHGGQNEERDKSGKFQPQIKCIRAFCLH